ncbi:insulin receptor substrate 1 isoform X3 [Aethina tumida]|uniref:insulin receptor substrate 1 isoform X3 n=1 Tax=Aethina tumida TaxID=116153 RepID=UPI00096AF59E|nr:insulin receptor substrate 1 isoform X3 [Aethina tumida]
MSVKSSGSDGAPDKGQAVRSGYLRKFKTMKKKWFVLRAESADRPARLEYYDSEKKYNCGADAKRSIPLKTCFNINKRKDVKHKHVLALYTKDECFSIQLDSEDELDGWLKALLTLQHGDDAADGETPKPTYEHIWQVQIMNRGIGTSSLTGSYRFCLTGKKLKLIKKDSETCIDLVLSNIRSCGYLKEYFYLEVGRSSTLGPGELWMNTGDENIAQNIHSTVYHAMSTNTSNNELGPKSRNRSSSATEASKPNSAQRKPNHIGVPKTHILQQVSGVASIYHHLIQRGTAKASERRHSISAGGLNWSGTICHQRTQSLPLAHPTTTTTAPTFTDQNTTTTSSHPLRVNKRPSSKCASGGGRERCDSMPTRPRTTSEGNHVGIWAKTLSITSSYRSAHNRDISHSPPSGIATSPPSVGYSESSGSSYSLADEPEEGDIIGRYSHPLTPEEAIAEEDSPDSPCMNTNYVPMAPPSSDDGYVDMSPGGGRTTASPTHSMNSITSGTPSTDIRFSEYPLEKVASYLTSDDDDTRPTRAYSVGSKPDSYKNKKHLEHVGTPDNSRVRAFSVGSKTKKGPSRVLPHHAHTGAKSSSAPMLMQRMHSSHGSIGPMDDLMEMDFSNSTSGHNSVSDYMDMKPGSTTPSGYVEMKPGSIEKSSVATEAPYMDMSGSSPARSNANDVTFVDMSRLVDNSDYMDMQPKRTSQPPTWQQNTSHNEPFDLNNYSVRQVDRHGSFSSQLSASPNKYHSISPKYTEGWVNSHYHTPTTPEGYVEMTPGQTNRHQRQSSLDSTHIQVYDDYTNMTLGNSKLKNKPVKKEMKSQPIMIQGGNNGKIASSPASISPLQVGRKYSTGTPPSFHLPLQAQYSSSLPRPRSRKNSRRDSKDSSSSSVTTPSSSSTIFSMSLNSPSSPAKPAQTIKVPASVMNVKYKATNMSKANSEDYTMMDYEKAARKPDASEYVNYNPAPAYHHQLPFRSTRNITRRNDEEGDYALMKPGEIEVKKDLPNVGFQPINDEKYRTSPRPGDTVPDIANRGDNHQDTARLKSIKEQKPETRPASVGSDGNNKPSRPSSTSSELCSSTSTLTGSRPESVNSDRIPQENTRPASVTCDLQLHYASLDLAPTDETGNKSPRSSKSTTQQEGGSAEPAFTYAEIDFVKSEGLKHNSLPNNAKVKH